MKEIIQDKDKKNKFKKGRKALAAVALTATALATTYSINENNEHSNIGKKVGVQEVVLDEAKLIGLSLNKIGRSDDVFVYLGGSFALNSEKTEEYGIGIIHNPIKLDNGEIGYIARDKSGAFYVEAVSAQDGDIAFVEGAEVLEATAVDVAVVPHPAGGLVVQTDAINPEFVAQAGP